MNWKFESDHFTFFKFENLSSSSEVMTYAMITLTCCGQTDRQTDRPSCRVDLALRVGSTKKTSQSSPGNAFLNFILQWMWLEWGLGMWLEWSLRLWVVSFLLSPLGMRLEWGLWMWPQVNKIHYLTLLKKINYVSLTSEKNELIPPLVIHF